MRKIIDPNTHQIVIPAGWRLLPRTAPVLPGDYFTMPSHDCWTETANDGTSIRNLFSVRAYIRRVPLKPETATFVIATVSSNANAFGLHGYVLIARNGDAYQVARSAGPHNTTWAKGMKLLLRLDAAGEPVWSQLSVEIPRKLPTCPPKIVRAAFKGGLTPLK